VAKNKKCFAAEQLTKQCW